MVKSLDEVTNDFLETNTGFSILDDGFDRNELYIRWLQDVTDLDSRNLTYLQNALFYPQEQFYDWLSSLGFTGSVDDMKRSFFGGTLALFVKLETSLDAVIPSTEAVDFSRSTTGTYVDSNGDIQTAAIDEARFQYEDGEAKGLLVEEERENLFLNSQTPATQTITVSNATEYTLSVIGDGKITVSGGATAEAVEGSDATFTTSSTSITCTVEGTLTHAQVEEGSFETSPIYTEALAVTRTGDIPSKDVSSIITQGKGSIYAEFEMLGIDTDDFPKIISLNDGTGDNRITIEGRHTTEVIRSRIYNATVEQSDIFDNTKKITFNTLNKVVLTYEDNSVKLYFNGQLIGEDTSATIPTSLTTLNIGCSYSSTSQANATLKNVRYYNYVLDSSVALTISDVNFNFLTDNIGNFLTDDEGKLLLLN